MNRMLKEQTVPRAEMRGEIKKEDPFGNENHPKREKRNTSKHMCGSTIDDRVEERIQKMK